MARGELDRVRALIEERAARVAEELATIEREALDS